MIFLLTGLWVLLIYHGGKLKTTYFMMHQYPQQAKYVSLSCIKLKRGHVQYHIEFVLLDKVGSPWLGTKAYPMDFLFPNLNEQTIENGDLRELELFYSWVLKKRSYHIC